MAEPDQTPDEQGDEVSLLDLLQTVVENLRLIVLGSLGVGVLALGVSFLITPTYTARTSFLLPQQQQSSASALVQSLGAMGGFAAAATGLKNPADQYLAFLKSESVLNPMVERFKLQERYGAKLTVDARNALIANTRANAGKDGLIQVEVDNEDPKFAAEVANRYIVELERLMGRLAITEAQQRRAFFEGKLKEARRDLAEADRALRATAVSASTLKSSPVSAVEEVAKLKGAITVQEVKIGSMRGRLTDSSPEVRQALVELSALRAQLGKAEQSESVPAGRPEDRYLERLREYKYKETLLELFSKQYELARVDEAREGAVIQVVDVAQPPERKSKPKKALIAVLATLASGFALLLFVFVRNAIRSAREDGETAGKLSRLGLAWRKAVGRG